MIAVQATPLVVVVLEEVVLVGSDGMAMGFLVDLLTEAALPAAAHRVVVPLDREGCIAPGLMEKLVIALQKYSMERALGRAVLTVIVLALSRGVLAGIGLALNKGVQVKLTEKRLVDFVMRDHHDVAAMNG